MNYKQKYLDALKSINFYNIFIIFLLVAEAIFVLLTMDIFLGYLLAAILFYWTIKGSIKRFLTTKKEIKGMEKTYP